MKPHLTLLTAFVLSLLAAPAMATAPQTAASAMHGYTYVSVNRQTHQWCIEARTTPAMSSSVTSRGAVASSRCCCIVPDTIPSTSASV